MQENQRNGQDDSDIIGTTEPFTITRAALNRHIRQRAITGSGKGQRINQEVIYRPVLVDQKVVRIFLKSFR